MVCKIKAKILHPVLKDFLALPSSMFAKLLESEGAKENLLELIFRTNLKDEEYKE